MFSCLQSRPHKVAKIPHVVVRYFAHKKGHGKPSLHKRPVLAGLKMPHVSRRKLIEKEKSTALFQPLKVEPVSRSEEGPSVGEELTGKLDTVKVTKLLKTFMMNKSTQVLAAQQGLKGEMFDNALDSFRRYCIHSNDLPVEMHILLSDIIAEAGHVDDLIPFFMAHAKEVYPHLECMEDLKKISNLMEPPAWYPLARSIDRKIIYHAGPTNSGKTYHALKRFMEAESGIYCGPLRLLAMEVFDKSNDQGTPCDLITGETRRYANGETPSEHVACTVEMVNINREFEVAVIDEIQMIADPQRGWAWTRALLGVAAQEIHVCGEETALDLVKSIMSTTLEPVEVNTYKRLTGLIFEDKPLGGLDNVQPGDCLVSFSKSDIFKLRTQLQSLGHICAVIYGDLPPGTKIMQTKRFNDVNDPCKLLVATDAVGMGLNLNIRRVVFMALQKKSVTIEGLLETGTLTTSQALQIAGRAGRYGTEYSTGYVTTFHSKDLKKLKKIVATEREPLKQAGMGPTAEQIEMFSFHLPKASLSNLLDIFEHVCMVDSDRYFMCTSQQVKELAALIEHLPIPLSDKFTLCNSPLKVRKGFACTMFIKLCRQFSTGQPLTFQWLYRTLDAPFTTPKSEAQLERLTAAFDVVDIYLWLSYRYPDMFLDPDDVRSLRHTLDNVIQNYFHQTLAEKDVTLLDINSIYAQDVRAVTDTQTVDEHVLTATTESGSDAPASSMFGSTSRLDKSDLGQHESQTEENIVLSPDSVVSDKVKSSLKNLHSSSSSLNTTDSDSNGKPSTVKTVKSSPIFPSVLNSTTVKSSSSISSVLDNTTVIKDQSAVDLDESDVKVLEDTAAELSAVIDSQETVEADNSEGVAVDEIVVENLEVKDSVNSPPKPLTETGSPTSESLQQCLSESFSDKYLSIVNKQTKYPRAVNNVTGRKLKNNQISNQRTDRNSNFDSDIQQYKRKFAEKHAPFSYSNGHFKLSDAFYRKVGAQKANGKNVGIDTSFKPVNQSEPRTLTERLISEGIMSEEMLNKLREEWDKSKKNGK